MNGLRQAHWWLAALFMAGQSAVFALTAAATTNLPAPRPLIFVRTNLAFPLPPPLQSPVAFFRKLLAMTPAEQEGYLTNRPPEIRARLLAKIHEYQALDPGERELRLRATELRWYLLPLLRTPPADRAHQLTAVPDDLRDLIQARLGQWDILPPPLQQEFLENERALRYFTHVDATNSPSLPGGGGERSLPDSDRDRWNALSDEQRQRIAGQFNQFFDLTPAEKNRALGALSPLERQQMEKTLQMFDQLLPVQRRECVRAFTKFADMSPPDRAEFLKNAQRWSQMSPQDRQTWRDLVAHVPKWPPLPPLPLPPRLPPHLRTLVATNHL